MALSHPQFQKLSDITADVGQVVVASVVIPLFIDSFHPLVAILGLMAAVACWATSLLLLKHQTHDVQP